MLKAEATWFVNEFGVESTKRCIWILWMAWENGRMELPFTLAKSCTHYAQGDCLTSRETEFKICVNKGGER